MGFSFEKLEVYKEALAFANEIYEVTKRYPKEEIFGITNQIRRAAMSIALNIAKAVGEQRKSSNIFLIWQELPAMSASLYLKYQKSRII
jgi:hypothetical protein